MFKSYIIFKVVVYKTIKICKFCLHFVMNCFIFLEYLKVTKDLTTGVAPIQVNDDGNVQ